MKWKHFPHYWPFVRGIHWWIPAQRPVTRSFDVFFDLHLNKCLSKQSWGWWFEMPSCPLWRHLNEISNTSVSMMTTWHGSSCITGLLWGESTGMGRLSKQRTYSTELWWFLCCRPEQIVVKSVADDFRCLFDTTVMNRLMSRSCLQWLHHRPKAFHQIFCNSEG